MRTHLLRAAIGVCMAGSAFAAQATIFTCSGVVTSVASHNGNFEVRYNSERTGNQMEPVIIYSTHTYLLGPVLKAIEAGQDSRTVYNLVIENRDGGNTRCYDGESENALIGISEKY
ncbi:hypothetical protein [Pseudoalteromonas ardens]|uniref:Uncharacterized protein n=1 Tax=Pseudoalteromonas rubra TaxID=43658 RepID=A0A0L0EWE0_9GAMM|nr:hypothetical protein [Pseudoalteromonas sp. R96]KNC68735.1 hypothetical protein AC626_03020 [Pseudoalteromonas rubra]MDK1310290.1 hypothetical protein [Pseudoalteromonas sp. R96]